jgi:hypothetical protein
MGFTAGLGGRNGGGDERKGVINGTEPFADHPETGGAVELEKHLLGGTMKILTRHNSPDGGLSLLIVEDAGGRSVGFVDGNIGIPADITSEHLSRPTADAMSQFVADVLAGRHLLAIVRSRTGELRDVFVADNPKKALGYARPDEEIKLRYWDGTAPRIAELTAPPEPPPSPTPGNAEASRRRRSVS